MSLLKIAITGPESSGKSTLAKALAAHYQTSFATEFAREYLEKTEGNYALNDLINIARGQLANERKAIETANKICFFDTDMLVLKIWAQYRFGKVPEFIDTAFRESDLNGYLLCCPDIPWEPDPFRESPDPEERRELFDIYQNELIAAKKPYQVIYGARQNRIHLGETFITALTAGL